MPKHLLVLLALPFSLFADFSATTPLASGAALNLETGSTAASGADLVWTGSGLDPQGSARVGKLPISGTLAFDAQEEAVFRNFLIFATAATLPAAQLTVNSILVARTNNGNVAKVLVTANSGGTLTLRYVTFGVSAIPGAPVAKQVMNNSSHIAPGLPNYGIAPSSLFIVTGSALADPAPLELQSSQPPGLPLTLNGASITVVSAGVTVRPPLYYTSPTQIAAVLPANTPTGAATLRVTHGSATSAPISFQVVPAAIGINTYDLNTGVATDASSGAVLTLANSGSPGQTIVLWTTGLGADPADSDTTFSTSPHAVNTPLQIYIGGISATVLYAGSSGYPGVNQINLVIPPNAPTGCWISLAAVAGGVLGNVATLPIQTGGGPCVDAVSGLNGSQIFNPNGLSSYRTGLVALIVSNTAAPRSTNRMIENSATAAFQQYSALSYNPGNAVSPGSCILTNAAAVTGLTGLNPGTISLSGPGGFSTTLSQQFGIKGAFFAALPQGTVPNSGGTFTFTGTGGADVGPFSSTLAFTNPMMTWTNPNVAASIDKTRDLTVTWTGGNPGSFVTVSGGTASVDRNTLTPLASNFICMAPAEDGRFTVPSYILQAMFTGTGGLLLQNNIYAPLTASGLDIATAMGSNSYSMTASYNNGAGGGGLTR